MRRLARIMIPLVVFAVAFTPMLIPSLSVLGQSSGNNNLEIVSINTDNLPEVVLQIKGQNVDGNFITAPISIEEDSVDRSIISEDLSETSLQIAFVMDPTQNLTAPGNTGDARWFEIASAASGLVNASILSAQIDLIAAYGPSPQSDGFGLLEGWLRDHQAVVNTLYQYVASESGTGTPAILLSDALIETLNEFGDVDLGAGTEKVVIVFSDGSKLLDTEKVNQVIDLAEELDIQLNIVMLGADTPIARGNLERLSTGTNGRFAVLNSISDLDPFWSMLQQQRTVREVTYNLGSANATELNVTVELPDGQSFTTTVNYPEFEIEPAAIEIAAPTDSQILTFDLSAGDVTESDIVAPVMLDVTWPGDKPREFSQIDYLIDGNSIAQGDGTLGEFQLALAGLDNGEHTLTVVAVDELGVESVSLPQTFSLDVTRSGAGGTQVASTGAATTVSESSAEEDAASADASGSTNSSTNSETVSSSPQDTNNVADAAIDNALNDVQPENRIGNGMNLFGIQLPETVEIFGVPFLINPVTLLIAAFPLIFALALLTYWLSQRSNTKVAYNNDYDFYDIGQVPTIENNVFFEDDGQLQVTQPQIGIIDIEDDITEPVKVPSFYTSAPAYLVYISGGNHLPKKLPIEGDEPIRIGRKKSFCELVLDDRRVSRLHSVISRLDDEFYIRDEGSSGGTFVNRRKLGTVDNQKLEHNDIINFNEVEYRFESTIEKAEQENANGSSSVYAPPVENSGV